MTAVSLQVRRTFEVRRTCKHPQISQITQIYLSILQIFLRVLCPFMTDGLDG
jgi:hypothetical protein